MSKWKTTINHRTKRGFAPWNKGLTKSDPRVLKNSLGHADKMRGRRLTQEHKAKIGKSSRGHTLSPEARRKIADSKRGDKSHFWKGGITSKNEAFRKTLDYRLWREAVFKRDNWTCIWCRQRGGILNADHIKAFALYPELRLAIDNGRTLCVDCHKTTETYARTYTEHERDNLGRFTKNN